MKRTCIHGCNEGVSGKYCFTGKNEVVSHCLKLHLKCSVAVDSIKNARNI